MKGVHANLLQTYLQVKIKVYKKGSCYIKAILTMQVMLYWILIQSSPVGFMIKLFKSRDSLLSKLF